jgi:hypothetical protein
VRTARRFARARAGAASGVRPARPACWILAAALLAALLGPAAVPGQAAVTCTPGTPIASPSGELTITIHHAPDGAPEGDARQCTPGQGSVLRGQWTVMVTARSSLSYLKSFTASIVPTDPGVTLPPEATVAGGPYYDPPAAITGPPAQPGPNQPQMLSEDTITFVWDTTTLTKHNGVYQIKVSAQSGVDTVEAFVLDLKVDNPPSRPTEVQVVPEGSAAVVSWKRNPEPDVIAYRVLRSADGGPFVRLDTVSRLELRDDTVPQGAQIRYQVIALRKSPVSKDKVIMSAASDPTPVLTIGSAVGSATRSSGSLRARLGGSRRGSGFEPVLPYGEDPPPQQAPAAEGSSETDETAAAPQEVVEGSQGTDRTRPTSTFDKMRYFGASLLLLAVGVLVAKFGRRILSAG